MESAFDIINDSLTANEPTFAQPKVVPIQDMPLGKLLSSEVVVFPEKVSERKLLPIHELNEFTTTKHGDNWYIEARVISKSGLKTYKNGKLFKLDLQDDRHKTWAIEHGKAHQIEVTCFKDTIDIFFDKVFEGKTYEI